jgi:hypothetical protein
VIERMQHFDIFAMVNNLGALSFTNISECLEKMTIDKIGYLPTFHDIKHKFNKNLVCVTYNITKGEAEYISYETHPTLPCLVAIRMTSNLPLIFENYKYSNNYYIDGGIVDNFAIDKADDMGKKVLSLMNEQGYLAGIGRIAEAGISTPVGSLSLPYQDFISAVKLKPEEQAYARLIDQVISELNQGVMKEGKAIFGPQISVYDAQKMAEPGFKRSDPPIVISTLVNKFKIMNHFQGELNKAQTDYFERNPAAKTSQFFKSAEYKDVAKQYVETMKKLNQLSPF